ncbi:MAG: NADH:ubiquinone reductase (Na(+)-transporting) subunit B [Ignavibacteria bacterium]
MKFLKELFEKNEKHFEKGGKLEKLFYVYEAAYTILFTPGKVTTKDSHVRDTLDLKRGMTIVVIALIPAVLMALYNTGYQANLALQQLGQSSLDSWQGSVAEWLGVGHDPASLWANVILGALYFFPVYIITIAAGGFWEVLFSSIRKHEINEGFLVTSLLFPLILPPNIPYWQVVVGISFGVVIGKEVFGGVGMNILNPALTARAFLFFAYPAQISGDKVWTAVDGFSQATGLAQLADTQLTFAYDWIDAFLGFIPGSMGETSVVACLIGAVILLITGVGSWRIMAGVLIGTVATVFLLNAVGSSTNPMFNVPLEWHLVLGGYAFGLVFMATDPVSAAYTEGGKWIYGLLIGFLVILVRVINPAFPEGMMLAILFGNVFAPIIDKIYINANIKRRLARNVG